jgi:hypothetical protein
LFVPPNCFALKRDPKTAALRSIQKHMLQQNVRAPIDANRRASRSLASRKCERAHHKPVKIKRRRNLHAHVSFCSGLLVASFIAFPSFPSTGFLSFMPSVAVDRTLKGDRLPLSAPTDKTEMPVQSAPSSREKIPVGCDRAFSPVSSPRLANVFQRCTV